MNTVLDNKSPLFSSFKTGMAEDVSCVSERAERKALQKAKILQRESERKIVQLVRLEVSHLKAGSAVNRLAGWRDKCLLCSVSVINILSCSGSIGSEETGERKDGGGGGCLTAAQRDRRGAL